MSEWAKYHADLLARDPEYASGFRLLELGEAVRVLREQAGLTRTQLARRFGVKAADISQVEEETFDAPAGLLEAALATLLRQANLQSAGEAAQALRTVRALRPALLSQTAA